MNLIETHPTPRDYIEDWHDENGQYQHECDTCGKSFIGHKRRGLNCKVCHLKALEAVMVQINTETHPVFARLREAEAKVERLEMENDRYHEGLYQVSEWAKAYPLKVFPEPTDWKGIDKVLSNHGYSLSCISASNMRHVVTKVGEIADAALKGQSDEGGSL